MLTNINANKDDLLQLILVGQPELRALVMRPELRQFAQRISATYHIPAMDEATVAGYVKHRLTHVGGRGTEFSEEAIEKIAACSGGVPRLVNKPCDLGLVYAAAEKSPIVTVAIIEEVIDDGIFVSAMNVTSEAGGGGGRGGGRGGGDCRMSDLIRFYWRLLLRRSPDDDRARCAVRRRRRGLRDQPAQPLRSLCQASRGSPARFPTTWRRRP